ncbi:MAG TPA: hypothetical protein VD837_13415 [Terriglobales bacterium]|nr:hypothetical protein [Terriglobales bacterium]
MTASILKSALKVAAATGIYAAIHSALASRAAKNAATAVLGHSRRAAFYRPFYLAQSVVTLAVLYFYARRLPDRTLYEVHGAPAALMHAGRIAGLAYATWAAYEVGIPKILGIAPFVAWLRGASDIDPEPEAQGPSCASGDRMKVTGPFRWSRHPLNFAPLPVFWLRPKMTAQLLAFNLATTVYMVLGSLHEEHRLRLAHGEPYERYTHSGISFYIPRPQSRRVA